MKKQKRICFILTILVLLGGMLASKSYANISGNVSLRASSQSVAKGEEFSVYAHISNLQAGKGIIALGAVVEYDTSSLTLEDWEGAGKWSAPSINETNGKLTATRNKRLTEAEDIFKLTFSVKNNAGNSAWVRIRNLEISDGDEESNIGGSTVNLSIKTNEQPPIEEQPPVDNSGEQQESPSETPSRPTTSTTTTTNNNRPSTTTNKPSSTTQETTSPIQTDEEQQEEPIQNNIVASSVLDNISVENVLIMGELQQNIVPVQAETPTFAQEEQANNTWVIVLVAVLAGTVVVAVSIYAIKFLKKQK